MKNKKIFYILLLSGILGFLTSLHIHRNTEIKTIQTFHYPARFVKQIAGDPKAGEKIFKEFCAICHAKTPTIDVHAPRIGDSLAWKHKKKWGIPVLLNMTIMGTGAMPARGGCFECSDEQLQEAIVYMLKPRNGS